MIVRIARQTRGKRGGSYLGEYADGGDDDAGDGGAHHERAHEKGRETASDAVHRSLDKRIADASEDDHRDVRGLRLDGQRPQHGQQQQDVADDNAGAQAEEMPHNDAQEHKYHEACHVRDGKLEFNVCARIQLLEVVRAADERIPRQQNSSAHDAEKKQQHARGARVIALHFVPQQQLYMARGVQGDSNKRRAAAAAAARRGGGAQQIFYFIHNTKTLRPA